jgi:hypothetical protein
MPKLYPGTVGQRHRKHERGEQLVEDPKSLIEQKARLKSELAEAKGFFEAIV